MAENYNLILYGSNLYNSEAIRDFGANRIKWSLMSDREKELTMLKITCNILLCNLEPLQEMDQMTTKKRKCPKRKEKSDSKKQKENEEESRAGPSTEKTDTSTQSAKTKSSDSWEEDFFENQEENEEDNYRLRMIKYMSGEEAIMIKTCAEWKIEKENTIWDLADRREKKFVKVEVTSNKDSAILNYEKINVINPSNTCLCLIDPINISITWTDHDGGLRGESKVLTFLMRRKTILNNLSIIETPIQHERDLIPVIFCSNYFNESMLEWIADWESEINEKWTREELYGNVTKEPKMIRPEEMWELLTKLDETEREKTITWKAKLSPEGWTKNYVGSWEKDTEMIDFLLNILDVNDITSSNDIKFINDYNIQGKASNIFKEIKEAWKEGGNNNFLLFTPGKGETDILDQLVGYKKKKRTFNPEGKNMKQKEGEKIEMRKYHNYFEEIIRRLNKPFFTEDEDQFVYPELMEKADTDDHPISIIAEEGVDKILKPMLKSTTSVWSSKFTNMYSRIGGAYSGGSKKHNKMRSGCAIFPIYANSCSVTNQQDKKKYLSGFMIRGPNHSKSPTDRIPIVTIEIFDRDDINIFFMNQVNKGIIIRGKNIDVLIRPNSVMKEDSAYLTFTENSLFNPINMVGLMTIENPSVSQNCNMRDLITNVIDQSQQWFVERFTEGILMAAIGNSRDEGYFACLRKISMIVYSWKNNNPSACWELESFCKKTNEMLIDNPLSMHFHINILDAINFYCKDS